MADARSTVQETFYFHNVTQGQENPPIGFEDVSKIRSLQEADLQRWGNSSTKFPLTFPVSPLNELREGIGKSILQLFEGFSPFGR